MDTRTVAGLKVLTPGYDPDDLDPVTEPPDDDLDEALVDGAVWPDLELRGARFCLSRLVGVEMTEADWRRGGLSGCRLERVDLTGSRLVGLALDRCEFVECRLGGVIFDDVTLKNVVFEDCQFDYSGLTKVRVAGPTVFTGSRFFKSTLTGCELRGAVFAGCRLELAGFVRCDLRDADLRGNDLSGLSGLTSLAGAIIDESQLPDLAQIAARELGVSVREPS
jgi:uncharacterized protein YjbI with pentapeptide repeats